MSPLGAWPLADRDGDVDAVMAAIAAADRDLVVLHGPAGVGKTRLADTCLGLAEAAGRASARVIASQAAALLPLGALAPILPGTLDSTASPAELFDQAKAGLEARSTGDRLLLHVDDAHLLDTASAVLLTQLADAGVLFLLATIREGEPPPDAVAEWWGRPGAVRIDLGDLSLDGTDQVLNAALGGSVSHEAIRRLHEASGGNPLLLRELVHGAVSDGLLSDASGSWRITGRIPPSRRLIDVLAPRLAALSPPARRVVDQLAVCAPLGAAELVAEDGGRVEPELLEQLERDGLIRVMADGDRRRMVLAHPLYGEALAAELAVLRRQAILLAAAQRTEELGARRREDARRVATWRLDAGGSPDPELLLEAARFARYAHDYEQVERLSSILWQQEQTAEVAALLGEASYELGLFEQAESVLAVRFPDAPEELVVALTWLRGQNLQYGIHDPEAALAVVQEARATISPAHEVDLISQEGQLWNAVSLPQKALDLVAGLEPDTPRTRVLLALVKGQSLLRVGRTAEAIEVCSEGFREHNALAEPLALYPPGMHFIGYGWALVHAGRFAEGEQVAKLGYDGSVADKNLFGQVYCAFQLADCLLHQGRVAESRSWFQEAASTAQALGIGFAERSVRAGLAATEAILGNRDAAVANMERVVGLPEDDSLRQYHAQGAGWTAWVDGDPERARELLVDAALDAAATSNVGNASFLFHDAVRLGATGVAQHLVELDGLGDSAALAARTRHALAVESGSPEDLTAAAEGFEELGMILLAAEAATAASAAYRRAGDQRAGTAWAERASTLAARCQGARTPGLVALRTAVPLSARELEIASLAAQGITSQEIANRLSLSVRTVNNHLGHAYDKLGVNRREQLAEALALH